MNIKHVLEFVPFGMVWKMDKSLSEGLFIQYWGTYYVTSGTYVNEIFSIKLVEKDSK